MEPLVSVLRIDEWTEQETYSLWYKEGMLGTRAVGEPVRVTGPLKVVCVCVSGNLWPLNGYLVSQEKMEVLSVRKRRWGQRSRRYEEKEVD